MIRLFEPSDTNEMIKLAKQHGREMEITEELPWDDVYFTTAFRKLMIDPINTCFVVEQEGKLIGYAVIFFHTKIWNPTLYGQIAYFYIQDGERNKWLADSLWNACVEKCKEKGAKFFESSVCAFGKDYKGSQDQIERASSYFEHKKGEHCGNWFVHKVEEY